MSKKVNNIEIKKIGGLYALRRDRIEKHVVIVNVYLLNSISNGQNFTDLYKKIF